MSGNQTLQRLQRGEVLTDWSWEVAGQVMGCHQTGHSLQRGGVLTDRSWEVTWQVMGRHQIGPVFGGEGC